MANVLLQLQLKTHVLGAECHACKQVHNWASPKDVKVDQTRRGEVLCWCVLAIASQANHRRLCRAYYMDGCEHNFNNAACLWVKYMLGKLQHAPLRADSGAAAHIMLGALEDFKDKREQCLKGGPWDWGHFMQPPPVPLTPHRHHTFPHFLLVGCELLVCCSVSDCFVSLVCYVGRGQTAWAANASLDVSTKLGLTETSVWVQSYLHPFTYGSLAFVAAHLFCKWQGNKTFAFLSNKMIFVFVFAKLLKTGQQL